MTHDPLCPARNRPAVWEPEMCICDIIAKVRADEREKAVQQIRHTSIHEDWCAISQFLGDPEAHCQCGHNQCEAAIRGEASDD